MSEIINFGPQTRTYITGLKAELASLDKNADDFDERTKLINSEIDAATKNLVLEARAAEAAAAAAENS